MYSSLLLSVLPVRILGTVIENTCSVNHLWETCQNECVFGVPEHIYNGSFPPLYLASNGIFLFHFAYFCSSIFMLHCLELYWPPLGLKAVSDPFQVLSFSPSFNKMAPLACLAWPVYLIQTDKHSLLWELWKHLTSLMVPSFDTLLQKKINTSAGIFCLHTVYNCA